MAGKAGDTAGSRVGDVGIRRAEIRVVERIGGVAPQRRADALGNRKALGKRNVLIDEARAIERIRSEVSGARKAPPRPPTNH